MPVGFISFRHRRLLGNLCHIVALSALSGCGAVSTSTNPPVADMAANICPGSTTEKSFAADAILLEWDGGLSRIHPGLALDGLDLALFLVSDGGSLADDAEAFKSAVRDEVSRILCDMPNDGVYLTSSKNGLPRDVTTVYFSQIVSPLGGSQIGQGEYDPCNLDHDNQAIIFGEEILGLGSVRPFDEWVTVFANVTAHEIGHMLGYGHVARVLYPQTQRPAFVELMLATHTVEEMKQAQRLISDETNCPETLTDTSNHRDRIATVTCAHE